MPIKSLSILAGQVHFDEVSFNIEKMELTDGNFSGRGNVIVLLWKGGVISSSDMTVNQVVFQSDNSKTQSNANITIIENCKVIANTTLNVLNGSYLMNQESSAIEINYPLKIYTGENGDGKFHSAGEIVVSTRREYETLFDLQFSSTGHLQMKRGQLLLKGSTSFTGSIEVEAKATLHFGQGTHDLLDSCSARGRGSIVVDEGTSFDCLGNVTVNKLQISGNAYLKGAFCVGILRINGGTTELNGGNQANGGLSVGTLELHDGSLQCLGVAAINGPALLHGGQVSISGSFYANSYLHISNAVTIQGNIDQQSDSCKGNTDCNSCSSLNLCTWHPSSNLCISKTRSGPQMCFQSSCSSGVQCFAYNDTGSCSSSADCVWCDWSNRCVRQEECSQSGDGVFWSSDGGGSWDEALNWHNGILPSEGSNAHIGYHSTNIVVRVNSQVSVKSISLGTPCDDHALLSCDYTQELSIESTLTVSGNITVHKNGRLLLKGNVVINGMIVIHGQVVWTWGTISGEGSVYNDGQIDIFNNWSSYGNYHNTLAITLQNHGDVYYRSTRNQLKLGVSTITNHETGTFHLESTRPVQSGIFSNFGLLVVFVDTYLTFGPVMHNHGKLQIMKGKLRLTSDTSCTGTIDIDADNELDFVNGIHDITTECTVEAGSATLRLSGSKVTFGSILNSISLISVTGNSDLVVNQNLTVHKMYWEYAIIRGDGRIAIDELLQWKRATVECDVEIYGKSELLYVGSYYKQISDCNFRFYDDVFIADGPITLQLLGDSSLLIEAAAFIHIEHGHTVSVLSSGSQTSVYNYGKIVIDGTLQISSDFYSYGQISVELGALVLTKSSQITNGKVEMLTSGNIEFRGNNHEFLDDVHLNLQGTLTMEAQTLTITSPVCQTVGQFVATSGMTEIRNQTNLRSVGGIDLYRSTLSIETAFNRKLDVGSIELKYNGHLSLGTSCRAKNILFSGSGASVNAIKTAVIEVYDSYTAFHGYSTRTARSVSTEEELATWKIYGTMHPNGLNIGGNYEIHHSLIHTDGSFTLTNSVNLTIMAYAQVGLLGISWSKSGSGVPRVTNYGAVHVFKTSNLNIPFHNHGSVQIYGNSGLRLTQDSNFTSGIINVMLGGWISFSGGSNHCVMQSCEINFAGDEGIYVYDRYTKLNLTQREFSDLYIDLNGAEANLYSSEPSNELKFLKFLKLIRGAHLNLHIGHMKVDKLHLEQSTIDIEGSELEVNILVTITGSSRDQSYLNGGKINLTQTTELHYPGTPTYSSVYVNVNTDLSIGDSSETLNLYGNVFYLKGTGTISNHRNTFIPENEVLYIYPFYQHIANMSIAGSLKVLGGGEISQTTLHFIHDGSFEVDGHDFYLTDVTFAGTGKILVHDGTLQISGQTMQHGYDSEGNLITLIAAGGNCKVDYLSDTSFVDILKLTKSGTVEINGNGHDNVGSNHCFSLRGTTTMPRCMY
ncbi:uncharacterized protein [Ptychodera flava]|uniref:uncharacterized protein n=1 Tax=Ptychodera flava TaxID=63121 RepID=UPI00396A005D